MYIHERENWTDFRWDASEVSILQETVCRKQGLLYGRLSSLGFDSKLKAMAENLTHDVVYSSEIEGIRLNDEQVRSSIARKLGIENVKYTAPSHYIDSVVGVMLEAIQKYDQPISKEKLCAWQSAFFPTGFCEGCPIEIGQYRTNEEHIVSGMFGREKIHYVAPSPHLIEGEMQKFIAWFDGHDAIGSVVRSAIAHFWFVSIHPLKMAMDVWPAFFQTCFWHVGKEVNCVSTISQPKSIRTRTTITTFWNVCNAAMVT